MHRRRSPEYLQNKKMQFKAWYAALSPEKKREWNERRVENRRIRLASLPLEEREYEIERQRKHRRKHAFWSEYKADPRIKELKFENQNGLCEICSCELTWDPRKKNTACQDHDHITKELRDVLCVTCNFALGGFRDDISLLALAIAYLQKHGKSSGPKIPLTVDRDSPWGASSEVRM